MDSLALDFTSALYLGLGHASSLLRPWDQLTTGAPAALVEPPDADAVAQRVAVLQGCERGLLAPSTLHLFWDLFGALAGSGVAIYADVGIYPIVRWGVERAAARGVPVRGFAHHEPESLRRRLRLDARRGWRPLIVTDGFCPGCGGPAPVVEYLECARDHGGALILDDTTDAYNFALGRRRAERVATQLRATLEGLNPGSSRAAALAVESRGERENISADPARNRRVQVCVSSARAACVIAPVTEAEFETPSPRPQLRSVGPAPSIRPCCMLAPSQDPRRPANSNLVNPSSLGRHRASNEVSGIVYTGKAGFIDLGHLRDHCDVTKFIHNQLTIDLTPQRVSAVIGEAEMHECPLSPIEVARAIALDAGLGHEIITYDRFKPGGHNSAFSPEDLCSNFLGTLVAERAIARGGNFDDAVTTELNNLLRDLDAPTPAESRNAFNLINGRWVDWNDLLGTPSLIDDEYLRRCNFTQVPFKTGHSRDKQGANGWDSFQPVIRTPRAR